MVNKPIDPNDLPIDLGKFGILVRSEPVIPGVYAVEIEHRLGVVRDSFLAERSTPNISDTAKRYGQDIEVLPDYLLYMPDGSGNVCYIIGYEIYRYKILHHLPVEDDPSVWDIAAVGTELYPEFFGAFPAPVWTPWGRTIRYKVITNGIFWLETEQCQCGLAVSFPKDEDLSKGAESLEAHCPALPSSPTPPHRFFHGSISCIPLFELISNVPDEELTTPVDRAALMNAIWDRFPDYAILYNRDEQHGAHDILGELMSTFGLNVERKSSIDNMITLTPGVETEYLKF